MAIRYRNLRAKIFLMLIFLSLMITFLLKNRYFREPYINDVNNHLDANNKNFEYNVFLNEKIKIELDKNDYQNEQILQKDAIMTNFEKTNEKKLNQSILDMFDFKMNKQRLEQELKIDLEYLSSQMQNFDNLQQADNKIYKIEIKNKRLVNKNKQYLILEYTKVFQQPKFCDKSSQEIFNSQLEKCEYTNCVYTCDKENNLKQADALIFHERDLETELFSKYEGNLQKWLAKTEQIPFPSIDKKLNNNQNQIWILWNDEASFIRNEFNELSHFFNWTLSYKTDAEIYEGSYGIVNRDIKKNVTSEKLANSKKEIFFQDFIKRQNAVLWFVSNCNSKYRIEIALNLSKYYPVYIYGKCDPLEGWSMADRIKTYPFLKVTKFNEKQQDDDEEVTPCGAGSECEEKKLKSFKYYLAFENKNCTDYVTEKVWRSLNKRMIPILLQPDSASYQRLSIPSKSFIHLENFNFDVERLSSYLYNLDSNFEQYYDHLKWTHIYIKVFYDGKYTEPHRMCQLCKKLNTFTSELSYNKIADFFNDKCKS